MEYQKSGFCIPFLIWLSFALNVYAQNVQNYPLIFSRPSTISDTSNETKPAIYYVCGQYCNPSTPCCSCYDKSIACHTYGWNSKTLKHANIEITKPNFIAENVFIMGQSFGILKKDETLPNIAKNVTYLQLSSNEITQIEDGTFDKFDALKLLSLSGNEITNLSSNILTPKLGATLLNLDLRGNRNLKFSSIDFTYMTNLKSLDLGINYDIGKLFASTSSSWSFPKTLSNLTTLTINHCNITNIPENIFENLLLLESLHLYSNPITAYPKSLNSISTLRYLDIGNTRIKNLNQTMLGKNEHLNSLYLQYSQISSIDDCAFCGFTNLTTLHLYESKSLSFIHENAFGYAKNVTTPKLESFSVEYCNLTIIPEKLLNWHSVKEIGVNGNPFNCSCEMSWLIEDILNPSHSNNLKNIEWYHRHEPLKCRYPIIYKDVEFYKLNQKYCKKTKPLQKPFEISNFVIFLIFAAFVVVSAVFVYRYLKKQKSAVPHQSIGSKIINENFENENFDCNA